MQPIEQQAYDETRMVLELLRELNNMTGADPLRCEAPEGHQCSVEVTHRVEFCGGSWFLCSNAAVATSESIDSGIVRCAGCKAPAGDCWTRPVPV